VKPYYEDDAVTIYHGDSRDILGRLPEMGLVVVVTDPPYGIGWRKGQNNAAKSRRHDGIVNDEDTSVRDEVLTLLRGAPGLVFGSFYAPYPERLKQVLVWPKPADAGLVGSTTGFRRDAEPVFLVGPWPQRTVEWSSVLQPGARGIASTAAATGHPHTKPVPLMRELISRCPDGIVIDPFCGSGSTLVAAKDLGRRAIGIEIDESYCRIAAARCSQEVLDLAA
jgi:site-specific DNA-methyltransferase (adenine-specific)